MASLERLNYLKGIVICHGKSEVFLAKFVCSNLHLNIKTYSKKNGANSIQINSLKSLLNTSPFKSFTEFKKEYEVSVTGRGESRKINNFKLFIIMDTDDCSDDERKKFITKEQFKGHWLYDYIVPIYNITNLEDVMQQSNIMTKRIKSTEKGEYYSKVFPINTKPVCDDTISQVKILKSRIAGNKNTNLTEFIDYCLTNAGS